MLWGGFCVGCIPTDGEGGPTMTQVLGEGAVCLADHDCVDCGVV